MDDRRRAGSFRYGDRPYDEALMRISTDRYRCPDFQARERETIWMKVWQYAGRADELPEPGDWKEHTIFDQSYVIVRGKDGALRGFVNACPHRGNKLCVGGQGRAPALRCPFHNWTFELDGRLRAIARGDLVGPVDKAGLGLLPISVDTWAGFIFMNPDPDARPLGDYLGQDVMDYLAPYHLEDMIPVGMNLREDLECNWKVVVDAFQEGYHIQGVHPQMADVIQLDAGKSEFNHFGDHHLSVSPFEAADVRGLTPEQSIAALKDKLPATYHGAAEIMPLFDRMVESVRNGQGEIVLADGVTVHTLLERATRELFAAKGLDVSGLCDQQMTYHYGWLLFPNFFISVRVGEATLIAPVPHPSGDPNRCIWEVVRLAWVPQEARAKVRAPLLRVDPPGSFEYFLVLQQDYEAMPRTQLGLRNTALRYVTAGSEEGLVVKFHREIDKYVRGAG
ncbi:MAG TPA: aromatic ring-hydroxylating dioxygenase subunit alpha [Novosphingobium sp.]|nr:aromatic ring-hydroxylating dioxygenase subunit alpha [Novosphingobium sp.]